jgi:pimeloyl-ACP methyl ester carboxylesterase
LASGKVWVPMMTALSDRLTCRAIDMPGHGKTEMPDPHVDFQIQAAGATIALIEQTGSPVHLVGHSYGGTIALRIAKERPDLIRSLVAIEPVYFSVLDDAGHPAYAQAHREEIEMIELLKRGDKLGAAQRFMDRWASPGDWARLDTKSRDAMAARIDFLKSVGNSILNRNDERLHLSDFATINAPTLLIRGSRGLDVIKHINDTLAQVMPNAQTKSVADAGHMVALTHLEPVMELMLAHWDS